MMTFLLYPPLRPKAQRGLGQEVRGMSSVSINNLARRIVDKATTDVIVVHKGEVLNAEKDRLGWKVPERLEGDVAVLWCYKRHVEDINIEDVINIDVVKRFIDELKEQGISMPLARRIIYYYRTAKASILKSNEKYTVVDIVPEAVEATAEAIQLYWQRRYSAKGRLYGTLRSEVTRNKVRMTARMYGLEASDVQVGRRVFETRIKIITNTNELEKLLQKLLSTRKSTKCSSNAFNHR